MDISRWWDAWRDLERHDHELKVKHVRRGQIAEGRLVELDSRLPGYRKHVDGIRWGQKVKVPSFKFKGPGQALRVIYIRHWKERKERRPLNRAVAFMYANYVPPAPLEMPASHESGESDPAFENELITWYARLYDVFAYHYGWSLETFDNLSYSAINEHLLAIKARTAYESTRRALEANPGEKGLAVLKAHPKRSPEYALKRKDYYWDPEYIEASLAEYRANLPSAQAKKKAEREAAA